MRKTENEKVSGWANLEDAEGDGMIRLRTDLPQIDTMRALELADNGDHYIIKASGQGAAGTGRISQLCVTCRERSVGRRAAQDAPAMPLAPAWTTPDFPIRRSRESAGAPP
jgi:hypothetical protein